ncbi:hypothetical protein RchiOBHm_Chr7g0195941 [Rosa chinensis]|uniref:Uncharacterized protein n=1 Tax=Rosa chinensis TaxID=74649 RepID=A0A2P6P6F6_ROSCH|nr:hypothetical protein RchiOBHm_Chr7g0195941 [Rosa chinensis]
MRLQNDLLTNRLESSTTPLQGRRRDHRLRSAKQLTMRLCSVPSLLFLCLRCCGGKRL